MARRNPSVAALVNGQSVDFTATEWGIRVPIPALPPGGSARISLLVPTEGQTTARSGVVA
jgi:hypothetical protein